MLLKTLRGNIGSGSDNGDSDAGDKVTVMMVML